MKKKILASVLCLAMMASLAACGENKDTDTSGGSSSGQAAAKKLPFAGHGGAIPPVMKSIIRSQTCLRKKILALKWRVNRTHGMTTGINYLYRSQAETHRI